MKNNDYHTPVRIKNNSVNEWRAAPEAVSCTLYSTAYELRFQSTITGSVRTVDGYASGVRERCQPTLFDALPAAAATRKPLPEKPAYPVPVFSVRLVRERELSGPSAGNPGDVAALLWEYLKEADREHLVVAMFTANLRLIGLSTAHVGSLTASVVSAREVYKPAVLANACSVVVAHNHPSGNLEPSEADIATSRRLAKAGEALDIPLLDSLVIGFGGAYTSLKERGLI